MNKLYYYKICDHVRKHRETEGKKGIRSWSLQRSNSLSPMTRCVPRLWEPGPLRLRLRPLDLSWHPFGRAWHISKHRNICLGFSVDPGVNEKGEGIEPSFDFSTNYRKGSLVCAKDIPCIIKPRSEARHATIMREYENTESTYFRNLMVEKLSALQDVYRMTK